MKSDLSHPSRGIPCWGKLACWIFYSQEGPNENYRYCTAFQCLACLASPRGNRFGCRSLAGPLALQAFEARHGEILLPVCVEDEALPLMRASLDGHLANQAPVELKCPGSKVWEAVRAKGAESETFRLCYPQVQHQILVTGADDGYLVFWHQGEIQEFQIPRDGP